LVRNLRAKLAIFTLVLSVQEAKDLPFFLWVVAD
jgi:hypothetical protein